MPRLTEPMPRLTEPLIVAPLMEPTSVPDPGADQISVVSLINTLLRYRGMIVALVLSAGFYAGYTSFRSGKYYMTEAQFMPKGSSGHSQLSGFAAQFGININAGGGGQSSEFYIDLLKARSLLGAVGAQNYTVRTDSGVIAGNLARIFQIDDPRPAVRRIKVINALKSAIEAKSSAQTGVVTMKVSAGTPELAQQIAQNVIDQLNAYNLSRRQQAASADRIFVERQVAEKQAQLRQSESDLEHFLESNREYIASPQLTLQYGRLQRVVDMRQQIYTSLLQAYETARIDEVRDLPVIVVVEPPELPLEPEARGSGRKALIGMLIGLAVGIMLAFLRDKIAANRAAQSDEFLEFAALRREAVGDLIHPWRPVARLFRARPAT